MGAAFAALLFYASAKDVKKRTVPNICWAAVSVLAAFRVLCGFLSPADAALGLILAGLPPFLMALIKKNSIGGGDIKLAASQGLFLGMNGAGLMIFIACLSALFVYAVRRVYDGKNAEKTVALVPYLAAGGILTYLLILLGG